MSERKDFRRAPGRWLQNRILKSQQEEAAALEPARQDDRRRRPAHVGLDADPIEPEPKYPDNSQIFRVAALCLLIGLVIGIAFGLLMGVLLRAVSFIGTLP